MAQQSWRDYYAKLIDQAADKARSLEVEGKEFRRLVREWTHPGRYGPAGSWGLKMWQQEYRTRIKGLPKRRKKPADVAAIADLPGQLRLFED